MSLSTVSSGSLVRLTTVDGHSSVPIKATGPEVDAIALQRTMCRQLAASLVRNLACYSAVVCLVIIAAETSIFVDGLTHSPYSYVALVVVLTASLVGVAFQLIHICSEFAGTRRSSLCGDGRGCGRTRSIAAATIVGGMLGRAMGSEEFERLIGARQESEPYLGAEARWRRRVSRRAFVKKSLERCDSAGGTARKTDKVLSFRAWSDGSARVDDQTWSRAAAGDSDAAAGSFWIIVGKDYRATSEATRRSIEADVAAFRRESGYDEYTSEMRFEYVFDTQHGDTFPDAEAFLVHPPGKPSAPTFYRCAVYRTMLCLALDSVYVLLFRCTTRRVKPYFVVKYIER